jgi:hypothetical protein
VAQRYLDDIRTDNADPVFAAMQPQYQTEAAHLTLFKMTDVFPKQKLRSVKLVGSQVFTTPDRTTYNLTYEYEFANAWVLGHVFLVRTGKTLQIGQIDVTPMTMSLEQQNAFTLTGKSPGQYLFLGLAILFPIFTIGTAIMCFFTPIPRRRWLWVIFVLIGFISISLNWTNGAWAWQLISFVLFGASYAQAPYGPPIIQIALPLGAIYFWTKRPVWLEAAAASRNVAAPEALPPAP